MHVVGWVGSSGSGKTTLLERLLPCLQAAGCSVSVLKHAHHGFELDVPGKDSWRHREAGAHEVLVASPHLVALQRASREPREEPLERLIGMLQPVDWVLVEGWRDAAIPKIEVWRAANGKPRCCAGDARVVAVATDAPQALPAPGPAEVLDLNQPQAVAAWLLRNRKRFEWMHASSFPTP